MHVAGIGRVVFWSGGSVWVGQSLAPSPPHAHHAIQICVGLSGQPQFRADDEAQWRSYAAAFIPSDLAHTFQANGLTVAHLFCEPESTVGRNLLARFGRDRIADVPVEISEHAQLLWSAYQQGGDDEELEDIALDALHALSGTASGGTVDDRVARATRFIGEHLSEPLTLEQLARHVGLSPGRFRHLFVAETGISFRAYLLWTRHKRALELGFGGMSWTDAAHATSFADSAHLSRTTQRLYGFSPTAIRQEIPAAARPLTA